MQSPIPEALLGAFAYPVEFVAPVPCAVPDLALAVVHVQGRRSFDPNGLYLLTAYKTAEAERLRSQQTRAADHNHSPLAGLLPVARDSAVSAGWLGILGEVAAPTKITPFTTVLGDPLADIDGLKGILSIIASWLRQLNSPRDLADRGWLSSSEMFRRYIPLASGTAAADLLTIGGRVRRNPIAFALNERLWGSAPQVLILNGVVHGAFDADHIYLAGQPFLVDVRSYAEAAPMLLDWSTLDLSVLLNATPLTSDRDWLEWVTICESLGQNILPNGLPPGRNARVAADLLSPLRSALYQWIEELPRTLQDSAKTTFWLCATITGLRVHATAENPAIRAAALAYAASAFDQMAQMLNIPYPNGQTEPVDLKTGRMPVLIRSARRSAPSSADGAALLIGVSEQADPAINSLPATADDVEGFRRCLIDICGFLPANVRTVVGAEATHEGIRNGFTWLQSEIAGKPNITAIVYYSGHGGVFNGDYYFIPQDVKLSQLSSKALSMTLFSTWLEELHAKRLVVLLDCCHAAGAELKGLESFTPKAPDPAKLDGTGRVLVASSSETQSSLILGGHKNSLFTEALIESLNTPGELEVLTVFTAVRDVVKQRAASIGREQSPQLSARHYEKIMFTQG